MEYNLIVLDVRSSQERLVRMLHVFIEFLVGISSNNEAVTQKSQDTLIATRSICKTAVLMPLFLCSWSNLNLWEHMNDMVNT